MDRFLLSNASQYQVLLKALRPASTSRKDETDKGTANPDMVVGARIRPLLDEDIAAGFPCAVFPRGRLGGVVDIHDLYNHPRGRPILKSHNYEVDRLFNSEATTEEIYEDLVAPIVPLAWDGGIGTLFAYGQTGSGKTFTVSRLEQLVSESLMDGSLEGEREIYITIIDLAGNSAFDLLNSRSPISLLEDSFGVTQLAGAEEYMVQSKDEMMDLIDGAASFRRTASTFKNDASSRSHAICRIRIRDPSTESDGLLYLIDLAGSEAARDIAVHGADRMRETREINISLSVLKDCILGKAKADARVVVPSSSAINPRQQIKKPYIPFRQSALTKVLKHVFDPPTGKAGKTVVVACINPSLADAGPSKNTLRYAEMLRVLVPTNQTELNPFTPATWSNGQLKDWITKNSGTPPIVAAFLAPTESGTQLLRLPTTTFESRCLKSPGVTVEQAKAFQSKLWQLHIDSQHASSGTSSSTAAPSSTDSGASTRPGTPPESACRISSRDPDQTAAGKVPFKQRIRPGMVVSLTDAASSELRLAAILSHAEPVKEVVKKTQGTILSLKKNGNVNGTARGTVRGAARYLCAVVMPGLTADAYELNLWQQVVVGVDEMEKEVILEYDPGTRYYYISV